jgi:hypothetical protein
MVRLTISIAVWSHWESGTLLIMELIESALSKIMTTSTIPPAFPSFEEAVFGLHPVWMTPA